MLAHLTNKKVAMICSNCAVVTPEISPSGVEFCNNMTFFYHHIKILFNVFEMKMAVIRMKGFLLYHLSL